VVVGSRDKLSFRFRGIKYAQKPERFTYSKYQAPSGNVLAHNYGAGCVNTYCGTTTSCSEDCLFLNIWTPTLPAKPSSKKKAVMFWIHGGGFTSGFGSDTTFDGANLASRGDVVVVTTNYRLSTLGFLAYDNTELKGNYWLSDLNAALDWVRAHIEDFGGDKVRLIHAQIGHCSVQLSLNLRRLPNCVPSKQERMTVFGQSAGAAAVRALLASPVANDKFSGAIMQSCPGGTFSEYQTISNATNVTKAILNETQCSRSDAAVEIACLRAQDPFVLIGLRDGKSTGTSAK
jgi:carboxylesterase type B